MTSERLLDRVMSIAQPIRCSQLAIEERLHVSSALREHLLSADSAELVSELTSRIVEACIVDVLGAVFMALRGVGGANDSTAQPCARLHWRVMSALLGTLKSEGPAVDNSNLGKQLVSIVTPELEFLAPEHLIKVLGTLLVSVEEGQRGVPRLLDFLAPTLELLLCCKAPEDEAQEDNGRGSATTAPGVAQRDAAVMRLVQAEWKQEHVTALLNALKDAPLTDVQRRDVVVKALRMCRSVDLQLLPAITHQLLLTPRASASCLVIKGLVSLFDALSTQQAAGASAAASCSGTGSSSSGGGGVLQQVAGTVIVHITNAAKFDPSLAQDWIKSLRAPVGAPSRFALALLFALCKQGSRLQDSVTAVLKRAASQAFDNDTCKASQSWTSHLLSQPQLKASVATFSDLSGAQLQATLLMSVSGGGSETSLSGVLVLCEQLVALNADGMMPFVQAMGAADEALQANGVAGAASCAASEARLPVAVRLTLLGVRLLAAVFEAHPEARGEVLRVSMAKLVCATKLEQALPTIMLLGHLARRRPELLYEHTQRVKECLSNSLSLPGDGALALLLSLWPLCVARREVADHVVLLLRKVMFCRDVGARLVAVRGFLHMITDQLRTEQQRSASYGGAGSTGASQMGASQGASSSQMSQRPALASGAGVSLLHELLGFLRKSLGQQAAVRRALYAQLHTLLLTDPGCQECIVEIVLPHLRKYYEPDEKVPAPIRLAPCAVSQAGEVRLVEPLPHLLSCVRRLVAFGRGGDLDGSAASSYCSQMDDDAIDADDESPGKALAHAFGSIRRRLLECDAEHFGLEGAGAELWPGTALGCLNLLRVDNLLGCLEVVMEDLVHEATGPDGPDTATDTGRDLLRACELHGRLYDLATAAKAPSKGKAKAGQGGSTAGDMAEADDEGADGEGAAGKAAAANNKRAREALCGDIVPVVERVPVLSECCLAKLCTALCKDGLVNTASASAPAGVADHARVARSATFQCFVLRGCLNMMEAQRASSSALFEAIKGCTAPRGSAVALPGWLTVAGPLMKAAQAILFAWVGRVTASSSGGGGGRGVKKGGGGPTAQRSEAKAAEGVAMLAARCVLKIVTMAGSLQRLAAILECVPAPSHVDPSDPSAAPLAAPGAAEGAGASAHEAAALQVVAVRLPHFRMMLWKMMTTSSFKEAMVVVDCLRVLGRLLPPSAAQRLSRVSLQGCQQRSPEVTHDKLARALLELHMDLAGADDVLVLEQVADDVQAVIGAMGQDTQTQVHQSYAIIHDGTKDAIASMVLERADAALAELNRLLASMAGGLSAEAGDGGAAVPSASSRQRLYDAACARLHLICSVLLKVTNTRLGQAAVLDRQTLVLATCYKTLSAVITLALPTKGSSTTLPVGPELSALVNQVNRALTPTIYVCIQEAQEVAREDAVGAGVDGQRAAMVTKARIKKELKSLPKLVFEMENAEKLLLLLSKAAHAPTLAPAKRSTNRGFRLKDSAPKHGSGNHNGAADGLEEGGAY